MIMEASCQLLMKNLTFVEHLVMLYQLFPIQYNLIFQKISLEDLNLSKLKQANQPHLVNLTSFFSLDLYSPCIFSCSSKPIRMEQTMGLFYLCIEIIHSFHHILMKHHPFRVPIATCTHRVIAIITDFKQSFTHLSHWCANSENRKNSTVSNLSVSHRDLKKRWLN